jgi:hypothetical protein
MCALGLARKLTRVFGKPVRAPRASWEVNVVAISRLRPPAVDLVAAVVSMLLLSLLVSACSSKATQVKSAPPGSPSTAAAAAGFTCPPYTVVNADLNEHFTGPPAVTVPPRGGQICDYGELGAVRVVIGPGSSEAELKGNEGAAGGGNTIVPVPHLGSDAFVVQGKGSVFVLAGNTLVVVFAVPGTDAQVESLARQIVGP